MLIILIIIVWSVLMDPYFLYNGLEDLLNREVRAHAMYFVVKKSWDAGMSTFFSILSGPVLSQVSESVIAMTRKS